MAYEIKPGHGSLFRNDKKNDAQPDYRGKAKTPDGKLLKLSGWVKKSDGKPAYLSLAIEHDSPEPPPPDDDDVSVEGGLPF